jgi:pimeloyl-ACP methyl ester carboxylesterase
MNHDATTHPANPGGSANPGTWLLLRGLTRETGHWGGFLPLLAERVAPAVVVAVDLPGAGARWQEASPLSIAAITDDLRRRVRAFQPPLRLLGLSMGGMVALDWAARHPQELAGALLVNTSVRPFGHLALRLRPPVWPALLQVLAGGDARRVESIILRCTSSRPAMHEPVLAEWAALRQQHPVSRANALRQLVAAARFTAPATRPGVPLRVLCAGQDALVDPACSRALANAWSLPLAQHPFAGHDLPLDAPDWVAAQAAELDAALFHP